MTDEQQYINGQRSALRLMLAHCIAELGIDDVDANKARWILEREAAIAALRRVCEDFGDNDWQPDLHLADIIEKHLENWLWINQPHSEQGEAT